jgi:hypothetical protein
MIPIKRDTQAYIDEIHKLIKRAAPLWRDASALSTVLRVTANEDFRALVDHALNGCKHAHRALCEQAALHMRDGELPPAAIKDYVIDALTGPPKQRSAGEDGARDIGRNIFIGYLVELVRLRGYDDRSGGTADDPTAPFIVNKAAEGTGMKMPTQRRVRDIWKEYRKEFGEGCGFDLEKVLAALEADKTATRPPRV